jgi:hypothetical protein
MLYKEITDVCCESHKTHKYTVRAESRIFGCQPFKAYQLLNAATDLTFKNYIVYPFTGFIFTSEQRGTFALQNIN